MQALPWALDELELPDIFPTADRVAQPSAADVAESLRAQLHAERSVAEQDAYARGRADGERAARTAFQAEMSSAIVALQEALASVQAHEARWIANAEENIAALSVAVARHIVQHEVTMEPASIRALVTRALVQLPVDGTIVVRLHPADVEACTSLVTADANGRVPDIRFSADPHIIRGGCLVEGRERIIDGRLDTALERAYRRVGNIQA